MGGKLLFPTFLPPHPPGLLLAGFRGEGEGLLAGKETPPPPLFVDDEALLLLGPCRGGGGGLDMNPGDPLFPPL